MGNKKEPNIQLDEIVVHPKDWQIDFHNNFGNKDIRLDILNNINEDIFKRKLNEDLRNAKTKSDIRKVVTREYNPNIDYGTNDAVKRLYNVYKQAGSPTITNKTHILSGNRPNYNPFTNTIHAKWRYNIISELAHPLNTEDNIIDYVTEFPNTVKGEINRQIKRYLMKKDPAKYINYVKKMYNHYEDPGHYEYNTHKVVEPELRDYIFLNKPTKYIKQMGGKRKKGFLGAVIGTATSLIGGAIQANAQKKANERQIRAQNRQTAYEMAQNLSNAYGNQEYVDDFQNKVVFRAGGNKHYTSRIHPNAVVKNIVNNPRMFKCGGKRKSK